MPYATQQNMIDRFSEDELIQLTDRNNAGVIDADVLQNALDDADGEIDGYLQGRYALPLDNVPLVLTRVACMIARYNLYDQQATDEVRNRYKDAITFLGSVGTGKLQLGLSSDGTAAAVGDSPQVSSNKPDRVFSTDTLDDYGT